MRCSVIKRWMPIVVPAIVAGFFSGVCRAEFGAHFEDLGLAGDSFWNGSDGSGGFTSSGMFFKNLYNSQWGSWAGWAYSSKTDTTTAGWINQYSAITGSGVGGSNTYGVAYYDAWTPTIPTITIPAGRDVPDGTYVTNTTYAYFSMRDGDDFVNAFTANDWQKLTITGKSGAAAVGSVDFDLALGTDIVNQWTWVDLSSLQNQSVDSLEFSFSGSQVEMVPSYVAIDAVAEPSTILMILSGGSCLLWWRRRWTARLCEQISTSRGLRETGRTRGTLSPGCCPRNT